MAQRKHQSGVFDVSHPGKNHVSAHASSKPILITNRPVIKDNVLTKNTQDDRETAPVLTRPKKVVLAPINPDITPVVVEDVKPTPAPVLRPVTVVEPDVVPPTPPEPVVTTAAGRTVDTLIPQSAVAVPSEDRSSKPLSPMQAEEAERLAKERAAKLQEMIEDEKYFLPINAVEDRRNRRNAILGLLLVVLLAAAWYNTALDAGLVPNMFDIPHTTFFTVK